MEIKFGETTFSEVRVGGAMVASYVCDDCGASLPARRDRSTEPLEEHARWHAEHGASE